MRKVLYYFIMQPYNQKESYVKVQYSNGNIRYWYYNDKGFNSARYRAMKKT
jgi:hypothetical protein